MSGLEKRLEFSFLHIFTVNRFKLPSKLKINDKNNIHIHYFKYNQLFHY